MLDAMRDAVTDGAIEEADFVVIGAGSAGSVLADRLTASGRHRVVLLEAGGSDLRPWIKMPIGYGKTYHDASVNWRFYAEPDPGLADRAVYWPRGKCMGGSSSINGLVYCRGLQGDFDDWRDAGNPGWGWEDVAPRFERSERRIAGDGAVSGTGRLAVADRARSYHPIRRFYEAAAREIGLPVADPETALWGEGVGPYRITTRRGLRCSASDAFLRPALRRPNLGLRLGAHVERILIEGGRARAVRYRLGGTPCEIRARGAILLAAGAVKSPQLLQLSGVGPGALLQRLGIATLRELPVGQGLQDHLGVEYLVRATEPTLNQVLGTIRGLAGAAALYLLAQTGPLSLSVNQMGGLVRSREGLGRADIQLYFNPLSYTTRQRNHRTLLRPDPWPGFAIGFNACRPTSRGAIEARSPDAEAAPAIRPDYLSTEADIVEAVSGARLVARLLGTKAMRALAEAPNGFSPVDQTDDALLEDFRARASTVYHACGTCRMAPEAAGGVVDPRLRVHGVEGLRVVDASIFPNITSANTNAPTIMVAQMAADMILADAG